MNTVSSEPELAEPYLLGWLSSVGLDVDYIRAERNTLYYRGEDGNEIPVLDFAGGYGSLILGHNHPEITGYAQELLAAGTPIHAQFSRHPYANDVALALTRILQRELATEDNFHAIFANTGAEAVEAAIKHAELDRGLRVAALREELAADLAAAREAVAAGAAVAPYAFGLVGAPTQEGPTGFEALAAAASRHNEEQLGRAPVFLTLEGGFHGKLVGSVQLTHNEGYRAPFSTLAAPARFVPAGDPEALKAAVEDQRGTVFAFTVENGTVTVTERNAPVFCAFVLEPIQGEGGIHVLTREFAQAIQRITDEVDCPVIVDEVQSGMGRSGDFLASAATGLRADYYALAKSLGGGIAKTSVMLTRQSRYRPEFELVHSSTFAKDAFSTLIAKRVLELLEADGGAAYATIRDRGEALGRALEAVRADYPDQVEEIRGRGLMQGLEFRDQSASGSAAIREAAPLLGYTIAGYLMREHRLRTFPTASSVNTLRFEPSLYLTDEEIGRLETALRAVCELFRAQDGAGLTGVAEAA